MTTARSPEEKQAVLREHAAGKLTLDQLAEKFGLSASTISGWAKAAGTPRRRKGPAPKPRPREKDESPRALDPRKGSWVYTNGIGHWVPFTVRNKR